MDPSDHLFKIDSAGMDPNPCMVYVSNHLHDQERVLEISQSYFDVGIFAVQLITAAVKVYAKSTSPAP